MMLKFRNIEDPRGLLRKLSERGKVNPVAVAFILTERNFRGPFFRIAELCYAAFYVLVLRKEPRITLGHCQVSFPYWRNRYGNKNATLLLAALNDVASYEICCAYLAANRAATIVDAVIYYNGRPSVLYAERFFRNFSAVNECMSQMRLSPDHAGLWVQ